MTPHQAALEMRERAETIIDRLRIANAGDGHEEGDHLVDGYLAKALEEIRALPPSEEPAHPATDVDVAGLLRRIVHWGESVENLEPCKSAEQSFPRDLLADIRAAIAALQQREPDALAERGRK